jgi:hypothetical protein
MASLAEPSLQCSSCPNSYGSRATTVIALTSASRLRVTKNFKGQQICCAGRRLAPCSTATPFSFASERLPCGKTVHVISPANNLSILDGDDGRESVVIRSARFDGFARKPLCKENYETGTQTFSAFEILDHTGAIRVACFLLVTRNRLAVTALLGGGNWKEARQCQENGTKLLPNRTKANS